MKFFRTCVGLNDDFYFKELTQHDVFAPILDIVYETLPRDNLLNSACLELFEFIKREDVKPLLIHIVEAHRERLENLTYVETFGRIILRYDQLQCGDGDADGTLFNQDPDAVTPPLRPRLNGNNQRWQGVGEMDAEEEHYFNTSDEEDELAAAPATTKVPTQMNGYSPTMKPLVDYPDDPDEETNQISTFYDKPLENNDGTRQDDSLSGGLPDVIPSSPPETTDAAPWPTPERLTEKRPRDDEEDELGKLALTKRRSSSASSVASHASSISNANGKNSLRRKNNFTFGKEGSPGRKIAISLSVGKRPIEAEHGDGSG